jgi:hypothetical protein
MLYIMYIVLFYFFIFYLEIYYNTFLVTILKFLTEQPKAKLVKQY